MRFLATTASVQSDIQAALRRIVSEYGRKGITPYSINDGDCEEVAERVCSEVDPKQRKCYPLSVLNLANPDDQSQWDLKLIRKHWSKSRPTHGLDWSDLDPEALDVHVWITDGRLHYDAECIEGVDNFFELPLFEKLLSRWRKRHA